MAKVSLLAGTTSYIATVFIEDSASTTGSGKTGLAFNTSGLTAYYVRPGSASAAITLATQTATGAYSSGGFVEIDATNMPGFYRFDIPNAVLAAGAKSAAIMLKGATGMAPLPLEFELTAVDNQSATFGLGTINANTTQLAGQTVTAAAGVTFPSSVSSYAGGAVASVTAAVTVGTNNDKTGYSLTQAFPTNFSSLAITAGGAITAGTVSDKTGYSLSQAFPTNFGTLVVDVNGRVQVQYGTATGQISATAGVVDANAKQINGSASAASNLAGGLNTVASGTVGSSATTTSIPTSAFSPAGTVTGQFIGRTIVFSDNTTTAALQGQATTITGSTGAANPTLTVNALTTAPAAGDVFFVF